MRVGVSTTTVELALAGGIGDGISHYTEQLVSGLAQAGDSVIEYAFLEGVQRLGGTLQRSRPLPGRFATLAGLGIATMGLAKVFAPAVDVFHCTDFKVIPARCPVVATLWDAIPLAHPEWLSSRTRRVAPFVISRVAHFADRIICATEHAAGEIVRYFRVPSNRVSVVPWGISDDWFDPVPAERVNRTLKKYELAPGFVLAVGTIQPRKNVMRLIEAYERLPRQVRLDHQLVIVGRLGWGSDDVALAIRRLQEAGSARWLQDMRSNEELRDIYAAARVLVFPSLYEGFGLPLLEAFASGLPVITSNATCLPEVSRGAALEFDPLDGIALADAIASLVRDDSELARRRELGLLRARELSMSKAVRLTREVYRLALPKSVG